MLAKRVSTACLINDTNYQQLGENLQKVKNLQKQKHQKVKISKAFYNSLRIISEVERLNFWNGTGCLKIAFRTCLKTLYLDPPCTTTLSHSDLARGMKFSTSRVQRAILKNSDMIDP